MINVLVITHGKLGEEMVKGAEMIIGQHAEVRTFQIPPDESQESLKVKVGIVIRELAGEGTTQKNGIIIMTDLLGGTPCNIALPYTKLYDIEIISGINLYMLITAIIYKDKLPLKELAQKVLEVGQKNIADIKKLFFGKMS